MANSKDQKLFTEFPPISSEEWEEKIKVDLKGADYDKKLVWKTMEGFRVNPYYRQENLEGKEYLNSKPGEFPFTRGVAINSNDWEIRQDIAVDTVKEANENALFVLDRGVTALGFGTGCKKGSSVIKNSDDLAALLKDIVIECISLNFNSGHNSTDIVNLLANYADSKGIDKAKLSGSVCYDPLGYLTIKGAWGTDENSDFNAVADLIKYAQENFSNFRVLAINGQHFNNAGASAVQELANSLAMTAEYLTKLTDGGADAADAIKHMQLNLGIGANYFMEIAKVRAARFLFAKLASAYTDKEVSSIFINSITTDWNQTIYDPYVNVLRATTEAMAAVTGGTSSLVIKPFDASFKKSDKFSERISRNIQIVLKEEAYFDKIVDPASGSYYIENITDSLIEEAWKMFLEIDARGGYLAALKAGSIQSAVEETAAKRSNNIATGREVLLGTNQFPNYNESVKDSLETKCTHGKANEGDVVTPVKKIRGALYFEHLRLATEGHGKRPKVFMLTYGNLTFRKARATFSSNFFASAGYEVIDNLGFASAEEGVEAAIDAQADIVVICSHDDEYAEFAPKVSDLLGNKAIVVVAGAPKCMDELKAKGIEHFIHVRTNKLESLREFNKLLGIK